MLGLYEPVIMVRFPTQAMCPPPPKRQRVALGPTQPPIQWARGIFPRSKAAKA
jgi:hypothetical protein